MGLEIFHNLYFDCVKNVLWKHFIPETIDTLPTSDYFWASVRSRTHRVQDLATGAPTYQNLAAWGGSGITLISWSNHEFHLEVSAWDPCLELYAIKRCGNCEGCIGYFGYREGDPDSPKELVSGLRLRLVQLEALLTVVRAGSWDCVWLTTRFREIIDQNISTKIK